MAATLTQKISLEGAEEVKRQVDQLGSGVEQAFQKIKGSVESVGQGQGVNQITNQLFSLGEKAAVAVTVFGALATAVVAAGKAFVGMAEDAAKAASAVGRAADAAGQSVANFQKTQFVLQQSGLTAAETGQAMQKFGAGAMKALNDVREAAAKTGVFFAPTAAGFQAAAQSAGLFGEKTKEAGDKQAAVLDVLKRSKAVIDGNTGAVKQDVEAWANYIDSINKIQDPLQRVNQLTKDFGETEGRRIAALKLTGAGIRAQAEDYQKLRLGMSEADRQVADEFEAAQKRLATVRDDANKTTGLSLAKFLTPLIKDYTNIINSLNKGLDDFLLGGADAGMAALKSFQEGSAAFSKFSADMVKAFQDGEKASGDLVASLLHMIPGMTSALAAIRSKVSEGMAEVRRLLDIQPGDNVFSWLSRQASEAWEKTKSAFNEGLAGVRQLLDVQPGDDLFGWLSRQASRAWELTKAAFNEGVASLKQLLNIQPGDDLFGWLSRLASEGWTKAQQAFTDGVAGIKALISGAFAGLDPWAWIVETFDSAITKIKEKAEELLQFLKDKFKGDPVQGGNTAPEIPQPQSLPARAPQSLLQPASLTTRFDPGQVTGKFKAAITELETLASTALQLVQSLANEASIAIGTAFDQLGEKARAAGQTIIDSFNGILPAIAPLAPKITEFGTVTQTVANTIQTAINRINVDSVIAKLTEAIAKAQELANLQLTGADDFSIGFARGGYTGNVGRSRVAGVVHGGEFVQRAKATAYYGVPFMAALNSLRIPRDALREVLRGFSAGGFVDGLSRSLSSLALPGYAEGGLVLANAGKSASPDRPVTFIIEGKKFSGFSGSNDAIDALGRASISRQIASTGKSPSWVR